LKEFCRTSPIIYTSTLHFVDVSWHLLFPEHNHNEVPGPKKQTSNFQDTLKIHWSQMNFLKTSEMQALPDITL